MAQPFGGLIGSKTGDEDRAHMFLHGRLASFPTPKRKYLEQGSKEDHEARQALVRLLFRKRAPVPWGIRKHLALLFDPDSKEVARKLVFENRLHSDAIDPALKRIVGRSFHNLRRKGHQAKAAERDVADQYKIGMSTVRACVKDYKEMLERRSALRKRRVS
jgi:hypothetical protein